MPASRRTLMTAASNSSDEENRQASGTGPFGGCAEGAEIGFDVIDATQLDHAF
jgi:hypothetical protein